MADPTLEAAARMKTALGETTELLLIGALAMAAHGYARQTTDIDFAVAASVRDLPEWVKRLEAAGLAAEYSPPDAEDPSRPVPTQGGRITRFFASDHSHRFGSRSCPNVLSVELSAGSPAAPSQREGAEKSTPACTRPSLRACPLGSA